MANRHKPNLHSESDQKQWRPGWVTNTDVVISLSECKRRGPHFNYRIAKYSCELLIRLIQS